MSSESLGRRLLTGALSGLTATTAMTATMRRLHALLPEKERYPLPPREIIERAGFEGMPETARQNSSLAAHFAYGAAAGAVLAGSKMRQDVKTGATAGVAIWAASYFGWVPGFHLLRPASTHPLRRDALMIAAHLVWGAVNALATRELTGASRTILGDGPIADAPRSPRAAKPKGVL